MDRHIKAPLNDDEVKMLKAGDYVYISGTIYTARDAAHKRMYEALQNGQEVPMPLKNNIVYYMGPSPAREGRPIGSAGYPKQSHDAAMFRSFFQARLTHRLTKTECT